MKTVIIVEDHPLYRLGIKETIEKQAPGKYKIVGSVGKYKEARRLIKSENPDIALIDISLNKRPRGGIELVRELKQVGLKTRYLIISGHDAMSIVNDAIDVGASGYIVKSSDTQCIIKGLEYISNGRKFFDRLLSDEIFEQDRSSKYSRLTIREKEVFGYLANGACPKTISEDLNISTKTISVHRFNIMQKLGFDNISELVLYALKIGIIEN
ncbi:MAG: response regulator transcription factor [bacterium]|nr:response regulator transcription factor [bacterium]